MADEKIRIAIVGGGCAALTAAFELTRGVHNGQFDVTVYQQGWRLGGKGASGRGESDRIEEHGLHLWMGWYENAFRVIRDCYEELDRDRNRYRIATWEDAFKRDPFSGAMEQRSDGRWQCWHVKLPFHEGLPGDKRIQPPNWTVADYLGHTANLLRALLEHLATGLEPASASAGKGDSNASPGRSPMEAIRTLIRLGQLGSLTGLIQAVNLLGALVSGISHESERLLLPVVEAIASSARTQLQTLVAGDDQSRRLWTIMDLTLATMRGILRHGLATDPRGFEVIDDYDCREWLLLNGASQVAVDSGYLRALYDLGFAYEDGDPARPRLAAGQALRSMLRAFFTYRGSFFWKMQSGMGDIVFAPLYEVLRRRGVKFEFFHRLENVSLAWDEAPHVGALEFDVQARTISGGPYDPLIDVRGLPCWPNQPRWEQLHEGSRLQREGRDFENFFSPRSDERRTLRVGTDFDLVVLGVGLGCIPHVCREIVAHDPRWRSMVDHVKTVGTQAFQVWLNAGVRELGWAEPPSNVSGFVEPFDTWADMSHLASEESWPESPQSIAYFVNALPDLESVPGRERTDWLAMNHERVRRNAADFLNKHVGYLWPKAMRPGGGFNWDLLAARDGDARELCGERRLETQFWTAGVNPTDRYTLSLPGSLIYRISPLDRTYDNLTIAGDWTDSGFNAGCVEAAVMSGMLAAHAISRKPALDDIIGYDHP